MKKHYLFLAIALLALVSCQKKVALPDSHISWAYDATIYELNTRQFTPEGTFRAAEAELPTLKSLGVDIIWVMPIQPIGELHRKGSLGSYYSIRDYKAFNPEFGTREDFESFLATAHQLGMKVILDWVACHTSPDSKWVENDGWHYRDSAGNLVIQYDWTDIAKLDYHSDAMREEMLRSMRWWTDEIGIDGFRCDVAMEIPVDFWRWAIDDIRRDHPKMFFLAEAEQVDLAEDQLFDMYYGWELHRLMNDVSQQRKTVADLWNYFERNSKEYPSEAIRMNFTSNHDENSWNGSEFERMGKAADEMAAFTYVVPGMPLIYTGQEYANEKRIAFFEKDCFERRDASEFGLYQRLNSLRKNNPALFSQEAGAEMGRIDCGDNEYIFACSRVLDNNIVIGIFNFSAEEQEFTLVTPSLKGTYTCLDGDVLHLDKETSMTLKPWEWIICYK